LSRTLEGSEELSRTLEGSEELDEIENRTNLCETNDLSNRFKMTLTLVIDINQHLDRYDQNGVQR
jgi:hypothetical protein